MTTDKRTEAKELRKAIERDILLCEADSVHFMKNRCKIKHPIKGKIPFQLYPFQERTLKQFQDNRFNIVLKSRQMGISTLVAALALWKMLFRGDYSVLAIATTQEVAKNLVQKVQLMYENLPSYLKNKVTIVENNKLTLKFSNGSSIKAVSSSPDAARSEALSLLILDEFAFIDSASEIWTSAQMTLATGGDAIILSTPNGVGNKFHQLWQKAEEGASVEGLEVMNPIKLNWDLHPDRDQTWRYQQDELLGIDEAAQECDCLHGDTIVTICKNANHTIPNKIKLSELYSFPNIKNYLIWTPNGFKPFHGIRKLTHERTLQFFGKGNKLLIESSLSHPFIDINGKVKKAFEYKFGDVFINESNQHIVITNIITKEEQTNLYDIIEVEDGNVFYANNILTHNCNFLSSGHTVVHNTILEWYLNNSIIDPIEMRGIGNEYWLWDYPNYSDDYAVLADVGRGDGSDFSTFQIFNVKNNVQVAEYKGKIGTRPFGRMLVSVATEWNKALLVIDNKNIGWDTVQECIELGYDNLYYSFKHDPFLDEDIHIRKNVDLRKKEDMVPGFTTTPLLRDLMITKLETSMRDKILPLKSRRSYNELQTFKWINGKAQAASGYHDDLLMPIGMYLYLKDNILKMRNMGIELNKRTITNFHKTIYKPKVTGTGNGWNINNGQTNENLKWLL